MLSFGPFLSRKKRTSERKGRAKEKDKRKKRTCFPYLSHRIEFREVFPHEALWERNRRASIPGSFLWKKKSTVMERSLHGIGYFYEGRDFSTDFSFPSGYGKFLFFSFSLILLFFGIDKTLLFFLFSLFHVFFHSFSPLFLPAF